MKMIKPSVIRLFLYSASLLFLLTAVAKFVSATGNARILQSPDPLLAMRFATVFWIVGGIETVVALFCFFGERPVLQTGVVAWLATNFVIYRIGLRLVGYHKPCSCLGNLTDALHISPDTADAAMKVVLGYLMLGSYAALFWLWRNGRKSNLAPRQAEPAVAAVN